MSVTAVIPAFNEGQTIASVLNCLKNVREVSQIIVVSDGSTDDTAEIAKSCGVNVIELTENVGKGGAVKEGASNSENDIILFLDADLIGLKNNHVLDLIMPVINNETDMTIGIFKNGRMVTDLAQKVTPYLSGQRAVKRNIFDRIPNIDITRYGVEVAFTKYIDKNSIRVLEVDLEDMTHVTKEEKLGLVKGVQARIKMYWDIVKILTPSTKKKQLKQR